MKMLKFVSFFLFAVFCCKSYAHENARMIEKKYIDPNNVRFEQKEMYVQIDQNWVVTNAVYTDTNGFYILETKGGWTCGYCGYYSQSPPAQGWGLAKASPKLTRLSLEVT